MSTACVHGGDTLPIWWRAQIMRGMLAKRSGASTVRDDEIAEALKTVGVLTSRQIQTLAFSLDNYTACKRRLTKLHRYGLIGRLPR